VRALLLFVCALPAFAGYSGYRTLTVDHTKAGATDSTNFDYYWTGTTADMATVANSGKVQHTVSCGVNSITCPADLVAMSDNTCSTLLSFEIEAYTASTGFVTIWIKLPTLSHTVDTVVYLCYGNAAVTTFQGGSTGAAYDANTQFAAHYPDGSTLSGKDSSTNTLAATVSGATAAAGQTGSGAAGFNGTSQYISLTNNAALNFTSGDFTIAMWVKPTTVTSATAQELLTRGVYGSDGYYVSLGNTGGCCASRYLIVGGTGTVQWTTNISATAGVWQHVVWARTGSAVTIYVNGTAQAMSGTFQSPTTGTRVAYLAVGDAAGTDFFGGSLDEVRVSSVIRSADWILAQYNNQNNSGTFTTLGSYVSLGATLRAGGAFFIGEQE
jgi:hypothetical protein